MNAPSVGRGRKNRASAKEKPRPVSAGKSNSLSLKDLLPNERNIVRLRALGLEYKEIAEQMHFSRDTINWYISSIYRKLKLPDSPRYQYLNVVQMLRHFYTFVEKE